MADTAFQTQYRDEIIQGFEHRQSELRTTVTTESVIKGNTATFLVADSGGATATTRGVNGLIPARANNLTQTSATLQEWNDLARVTDFNVFASQGNQRQILQTETMAVINRKIDDDIIAQLDTATVDTGAATTGGLGVTIKALVILGNAFVPTQEVDNMFAVVTPAFMGYLMQTTEFSNSQWVDVKTMTGGMKKYLRWMGINWIMHPRLTGVGTASEKCYIYHRSALGHAINTAGIDTAVGYNDEQAYSYARCSAFMGSKLLQNTGIVQILHDGSAYVGS